ncbi:MAG: DUF3634 family protein [Bacteroidetes bacterium]|nr:DUF3634 family protein [Bacteroidota bacterium]
MKKIIGTLELFFCLLQWPVFIIKIGNGKTKIIKGNVKYGFMTACEEIIQRNGGDSGCIYAVRRPYDKPVLKVSHSVPADVLQQLRNVWAQYA